MTTSRDKHFSNDRSIGSYGQLVWHYGTTDPVEEDGDRAVFPSHDGHTMTHGQLSAMSLDGLALTTFYMGPRFAMDPPSKYVPSFSLYRRASPIHPWNRVLYGCEGWGHDPLKYA